MMNCRLNSLVAVAAVTLFTTSCSHVNAPAGGLPVTDTSLHLAFTVTPAPDWSSLFNRNHGWFGGDGIFSETISAATDHAPAKTLIWFSDTMVGDIEGDTLSPGYGMINNSIAVLTDNKPDSTAISFRWASNDQGKPRSVWIPHTPATADGEYYWLGDGFVNAGKDNNLYIFGYRISDIPGVAVFGFREVGNTMLVVPIGSGDHQPGSGDAAPFPAGRQMDIPFFAGQNVDSVGSFGAAVLLNGTGDLSNAGSHGADGYLYIYGVRGKTKQVLVARVKPEEVEQFTQWRFWNGSGWSADVKDLQPIADRASNEMSVTALPDGRFVMVFQKDGMGRQVALRVGRTPYGPFGEIQDVYDVSEDLKQSKNFFPYNAKAHPALSGKDELLISYNINSFDFHKEILQYPHLYRPRFIRLKLR